MKKKKYRLKLDRPRNVVDIIRPNLIGNITVCRNTFIFPLLKRCKVGISRVTARMNVAYIYNCISATDSSGCATALYNRLRRVNTTLGNVSTLQHTFNNMDQLLLNYCRPTLFRIHSESQ